MLLIDLFSQPGNFRLVYHWSSSSVRPVRPKHRRLWPASYLPGDAPALGFTSAYTLMTWPSHDWLNGLLQERVRPESFR